MSDLEKIELAVNYIGLSSILAFPIVIGIPLIGFVVEIAAIFSVILLSYRRRIILLVIGISGSTVLSLYIFGPNLFLLAIWAKVILPGVVLGWLLSDGSSPQRAFVTAVICVAVFTSLLFWGGKDLFYSALDDTQEWVTSDLIGSSLQGEEGEAFVNWAVKMIAVIKRLTPSLMILSGISQLFLGMICLIVMMKSMGEFVPKFINFYYWKMPDYYLYIMGMFIFARLIGGETIRLVSDNVLLLLGFFYAIFGFSVFEFYLKKIRLSPFFRILFYISFIFLQLPGLILAAIVGLFDSYFDFRKVKARIIG